mmetsp:Transcript_35078/g.49061  ORF Transcript_35078/g.49061 Transcript_35078/m.49061 type:complete len:614 (-) Transcript_35078:635-2476(-)
MESESEIAGHKRNVYGQARNKPEQWKGTLEGYWIGKKLCDTEQYYIFRAWERKSRINAKRKRCEIWIQKRNRRSASELKQERDGKMAQEIKTMKTLRGYSSYFTNILDHFVAKVSGTDRGIIVQEMHEGSLRAYLHHPGKAELSFIHRQAYFRQIIDAISVMHNAGIIHTNLHLGNILIGSDGNIRLTDFSSCITNVTGDEGRTCKSRRATKNRILHGYQAPETKTNGTFSMKTDIFTAGVVLFYLLYKYPPFIGEDSIDISNRTVEEKEKFWDAHFKANFQSKIKNDRPPSHRGTLGQLDSLKDEESMLFPSIVTTMLDENQNARVCYSVSDVNAFVRKHKLPSDGNPDIRLPRIRIYRFCEISLVDGMIDPCSKSRWGLAEIKNHPFYTHPGVGTEKNDENSTKTKESNDKDSKKAMTITGGAGIGGNNKNEDIARATVRRERQRYRDEELRRVLPFCKFGTMRHGSSSSNQSDWSLSDISENDLDTLREKIAESLPSTIAPLKYNPDSSILKHYTIIKYLDYPKESYARLCALLNRLSIDYVSHSENLEVKIRWENKERYIELNADVVVFEGSSSDESVIEFRNLGSDPVTFSKIFDAIKVKYFPVVCIS